MHKKYPQYKIWVTGHSLGGAVASIASAEIASMDRQAGDRIGLVTFGQPRTGDYDYSAAHDDY
ncbi:Protein Y49E10.18, partial [Aphelenchoides avenae]